MKKQYRLAPAFENDINDSINEALGISVEVCKITGNLMNFLKKNLSSAIKATLPSRKYNLGNLADNLEGFYIFNKNVIMEDMEFILYIDVLNFQGLDKQQKEEVVVRYLNANCRQTSERKFMIRGSLPVIDFQLDCRTYALFSHELKHSWIYSKRPAYDSSRADKRNINYFNWRKLYDFSISFIRTNASNKNRDSFVSGLYKIAQALYISDSDEISAFAQQAYAERRVEDSPEAVDNIIRGSQMYKYTQNLSEVIEMFENTDVSEYISFIEQESGVSISKKKLLYLFKKRYNRCIDILRKLLVAHKTFIEESWGAYAADMCRLNWFPLSCFLLD